MSVGVGTLLVILFGITILVRTLSVTVQQITGAILIILGLLVASNLLAIHFG